MISNEFYEIKYLERKNRFLCKKKGDWECLDIAQNYKDDWKLILSKAKPNFTVITDLTEMKLPPVDIGEYLLGVQSLLYTNGMVKFAEIVELTRKNLSVDRIAYGSDIVTIRKQFHTYNEAEKWLNSVNQ